MWAYSGSTWWQHIADCIDCVGLVHHKVEPTKGSSADASFISCVYGVSFCNTWSFSLICCNASWVVLATIQRLSSVKYFDPYLGVYSCNWSVLRPFEGNIELFRKGLVTLKLAKFELRKAVATYLKLRKLKIRLCQRHESSSVILWECVVTIMDFVKKSHFSPFICTTAWRDLYVSAKAFLCSALALVAPNYVHPFKIKVYAYGAGVFSRRWWGLLSLFMQVQQ